MILWTGGSAMALDKAVVLPVLTDEERDVVTRVAALAKERFGDRLEAAVLYGSRARRDHRPADSDYDILLLVQAPSDTDHAARWELHEFFPWRVRELLDIRVIPAEHFTESNHFFFHENVMREGVWL